MPLAWITSRKGPCSWIPQSMAVARCDKACKIHEAIFILFMGFLRFYWNINIPVFLSREGKQMTYVFRHQLPIWPLPSVRTLQQFADIGPQKTLTKSESFPSKIMGERRKKLRFFAINTIDRQNLANQLVIRWEFTNAGTGLCSSTFINHILILLPS